MSLDAVVFWTFVAAWVVVVALIVFAGLIPAARQAIRIVKRVMALVADSPLPPAVERAGNDARRLNAALDELPDLQTRAKAAVETIQTTPIIPPALSALAARIEREIRAFRLELRR
jgi:hypothetical protein